MFYKPQDGHGLPHNPFNALVAPRPIAWVGTRGPGGDNLAPYSFFNAVAYEPPQVMFASTSAKVDRPGTKDSVALIKDTGVFSVSIVSARLREAMNATAAPLAAGVDEFDHAQLDKAPCETIDCPRVSEAPAALECTLTQILRLPGDANFAVFGEVTGVHIDPNILTDGRVDYAKAQFLSRLGYMDYAVIKDPFAMARPG